MSGEGNIGAERSLLQIIGSNAPDAKVARGKHNTDAADDTVDTGLTEVFGVIAMLVSDPAADCSFASAQVGSGGEINIKTWKLTGTSDTTPTAATAFSKDVEWVAFGR